MLYSSDCMVIIANYKSHVLTWLETLMDPKLTDHMRQDPQDNKGDCTLLAEEL